VYGETVAQKLEASKDVPSRTASDWQPDWELWQQLGLKQRSGEPLSVAFNHKRLVNNTTKPSRLAWKQIEGRAEESPGSWQQIICWSTVSNILFIAYVNNRYSGRAPVHRRLEMNMDKFDQKVGALRRRVLSFGNAIATTANNRC